MTRERYAHLACRMCGRLADPLVAGTCIPCLDLQDEIDAIGEADHELATDERYFQ